MKLKNFNGLFGVLENNQVNTAKDATNFMGAFNQIMRTFQMTSLIPQLVDINGSASDFDSLVKACLEEFWHKYEKSSDKHLVEQASLAKQLYENDELRKKFFDPLKKVLRMGGACESWSDMLEMWNDMIVDTTWFRALTNGKNLLVFLSYIAGAALIILPLVPGFWGALSTADKVYWGGYVSGLPFTFYRSSSDKDLCIGRRHL